MESEEAAVRRPHFWTTPTNELHRFGCPAGIVTLLYFYMRASYLFLVLFLLSLYSMSDNFTRNMQRNDCRIGSLMFTSDAACGRYEGLMTAEPSPPIGFITSFAQGTCWEPVQRPSIYTSSGGTNVNLPHKNKKN